MSDRTITVDGHPVELSNLDKIFFPESGVTKGDLVDYYRRIAEVALPHYRGRALTMQRFPDGIRAEGFFQKQAGDYFPGWIRTARLSKEGGTVDYVVADDAATLVYLANQGCITPHVALAQADNPRNPDRLVFDLDPSDDDFAKVQRAAKCLRRLLGRLELPAFVQTTGSRGLHVVVPLDQSADFEAARAFARRAAERLVDAHPDELTIEQRKNKRGDRVFIDYLRNAYGQTAVAPYAVRAREGAPVATPLRWREASASDLAPDRYTMNAVLRRLAQTTDPWAEIDRSAVSIGQAAERLNGLALD